MQKKWKVLALLVAVMLLFAGNAMADELLSLKVGYQLLEPEGSLAGNDVTVGTKVDLEDDLDLDDSEEVTAEIALQLGDFRLSFNYLPIEFSGTGTLTVEGDFNGERFEIGETVHSEVKLDLYDIGLTYYLLNFDDLPSRFQLGIELAVKVADTEIEFNVPDAADAISEQESEMIPIPTVGLRTRVALADFIGVVGRVGYMEYDDNSFTDAEVQLEFSPIPNIGIYAGYRYFELEIDEADIFVDVEFSGPFAGVLARF